jgi:hypothetical protein
MDESEETVVDALVKRATSFSNDLNNVPVCLDNLPDQVKDALKDEPLWNVCWNSFPVDSRALIWNAEIPDMLKTALLHERRNVVIATSETICLGIIANAEAILRVAPERAVSLFGLFLKLKEMRKKLQSTSSVRKSLDALSDKSKASGAELGNTLTGEKVHHSMFASEEFREQAFLRFEFPEDFVSSGDNLFVEAAETLETIQSFLDIAKPRAKEPFTRALFSLFLEKLVKDYNASMSLQDQDSRYAVTPVTDMKAIPLDVTVSEKYMLENCEMRTLANKDTTPAYKDGVWNTKMSIQSDLVVCPFSLFGDGESSEEEQQQHQFINCDVIIEMKRFRSLLQRQNKSALTQLSAESYARKTQKNNNPQVLYSVLTDCCGMYALCHVVKPEEGQSDEYWISRLENSPERFVAVLFWLLKRSRSTDEGALDFMSWKVDTAQELHAAKNEDDGDPRSSQERMTRARDTDSSGAKQPPAKRNRRDNREGITWDDFESDDDSEDEIDWSHFYALQRQRQAGQAFHFTADFVQG